MAANPTKIQEYLDSLVTDSRVAKGFGVSLMTIYAWRNSKDLPVYVIKGDGRPAIRFDLALVSRWAQKNGKVFDLHTA